MDRDGRLLAEEYDKNNCCTGFTIIVNLVMGITAAALEMARKIWNSYDREKKLM